MLARVPKLVTQGPGTSWFPLASPNVGAALYDRRFGPVHAVGSRTRNSVPSEDDDDEADHAVLLLRRLRVAPLALVLFTAASSGRTQRRRGDEDWQERLDPEKHKGPAILFLCVPLLRLAFGKIGSIALAQMPVTIMAQTTLTIQGVFWSPSALSWPKTAALTLILRRCTYPARSDHCSRSGFRPTDTLLLRRAWRPATFRVCAPRTKYTAIFAPSKERLSPSALV